MEKICKECKTPKPLDEFWNHPATADKKRSKCKSCMSRHNNDFQKKKRKDFPEIYRNSKLKQKFGMSLDSYDAMLSEQGGVCAICNFPPDEGKIMSVDHDHKTGNIRGIVHQRCNAAIGLLQDSPEICKRAAEYLESGGFIKIELTESRTCLDSIQTSRLDTNSEVIGLNC